MVIFSFKKSSEHSMGIPRSLSDSCAVFQRGIHRESTPHHFFLADKKEARSLAGVQLSGPDWQLATAISCTPSVCHRLWEA
jgi:hypothetical protein